MPKPLMNFAPALHTSRSATGAWLHAVETVFISGMPVAPRSHACNEVLHATAVLPMSHPVVTVPARKLSYSFAAAEALAILAGDARVASLAPFAPRVRDFSDDGVSFSGAYGPPVVEQLPYVLGALFKDRDTRQAWLTIWRPSPPPSKDIPCTIALGFMIRAGWLNVHAYMRSSDVWLGLPYDMFTFSMIGARVACAYNADREAGVDPIALGYLFLTAASSHLYEVNAEAAKKILVRRDTASGRSEPLPVSAITDGDWATIEGSLRACRDKTDGDGGRNVVWQIRP